MSPIHLEIFDLKRSKIFSSLQAFKTIGYLAGGTALALQINHRKSYDFDIFTPEEISNVLRYKVKTIFGDVSYLIDSGDQLSFQTHENINLTFLWYYFKPIRPLLATDSLPLASIFDIAADKAHTMGRRAAWRDYVDIFWLLHSKLLTLEEISQSAQQKFKGAFNEAQFLEQLTYYKDVAIAPIEFITMSVSSQEIQKYLQQSVSEYIKRKIP